jgi:hypothetical protein
MSTAGGLPDYREVDPMDPGESEAHYAKHEGYIEGWNDCLDEVKRAAGATPTRGGE